MNVIETLNKQLLEQPFEEKQSQPALLTEYQEIARRYSVIENSIAVLSDLKSRRSYIYNGGIAEVLGLSDKNSSSEIEAIWEEDIFNKIHPDDLLQKHVSELHFFHLLKSSPLSKRFDYQLTSLIRMLNKEGNYIPVKHRIFYICSFPNGTLWLSLCLYNLSEERYIPEKKNQVIFNSATGEIIYLDKKECNNILSQREKEILSLIRQGKLSKEISDILSISINTVNRHRQNILEKLNVNNSIEACRIAEAMDMFND